MFSFTANVSCSRSFSRVDIRDKKTPAALWTHEILMRIIRSAAVLLRRLWWTDISMLARGVTSPQQRDHLRRGGRYCACCRVSSRRRCHVVGLFGGRCLTSCPTRQEELSCFSLQVLLRTLFISLFALICILFVKPTTPRMRRSSALLL